MITLKQMDEQIRSIYKDILQPQYNQHRLVQDVCRHLQFHWVIFILVIMFFLHMLQPLSKELTIHIWTHPKHTEPWRWSSALMSLVNIFKLTHQWEVCELTSEVSTQRYDNNNNNNDSCTHTQQTWHTDTHYLFIPCHCPIPAPMTFDLNPSTEVLPALQLWVCVNFLCCKIVSNSHLDNDQPFLANLIQLQWFSQFWSSLNRRVWINVLLC